MKLISKSKETFSDSFLILKESILSFYKNNDFDTAACLAYYGLFALIPVFFLIIYFLGTCITSSQTAIKELEALWSQMLPGVSKVILKEVSSLFAHKDIWGITGIIVIFWTITPLASGLRNAFFKIFNLDNTSIFKAKIKDCFIIIFMLILFSSLVLIQIFYLQVVIGFLKRIPIMISFFNFTGSLCITTLCMSLFYFIMSPVKLKKRYIITGSMITALMWTVMKPAFSILVIFNPKFGFAFGSLKAIFIILLWVYYSFCLLLFGGEIMANLRKKDVLLLKKLFGKTKYLSEGYKTKLQKLIKTYKYDEVIFNEGDEGNNMFYILSGTVDITKNEQLLNTMKEGEYFGEMAMLLNSPRTATVTAKEDNTTLISISQDNFEIIMKEEPEIVRSILKEISKRLTGVNYFK